MSIKREVKMEVEDTKKIKVEAYCYLCQIYGHILSQKCVAMAVCLDCSHKGHVSRDCKEERIQYKDEIKFEVKVESNSSESEYVESGNMLKEAQFLHELEILKDEPNNGESKSVSEYIKEEDEFMINVKTEVYCILCQLYGHKFTEACVVNIRCFACGQKGHVRKDCWEDKSELKSVKLEIKRENVKCKKEYVENDKVKLEPENVKVESIKSEEEYVQISEDKIKEVNLEGNNAITQARYVCKECDYTSKLKETLALHMQVKHDGVPYRQYTYQECSYETKNKRKHILAEQEGVKYNCQKCNFETKYKFSLTKHMQVKHEGVQYTCQKCSYVTKYKSSLKRHMEVKHDGLGYVFYGLGYACKNCNYRTECKTIISRHTAECSRKFKRH